MGVAVVAAILAGGKSQRFGADKALADIAGAPMISHVARVLRADAGALAVVGHPGAAAVLGATALSDPADAVAGPLAGVLAALDWAEALGADWLVTAPCDAPLLPPGMGGRLIGAAEAVGAAAAYAETSSGAHPLCGVWRPALAGDLRASFARGVHPPVRQVTGNVIAERFADDEAFANVNTPADMARVRDRLRS